jgi:hypothetical protein
MRRADVKAGLIYAKTHDYGSVVPVMFLQDGGKGVYRKPLGNETRPVEREKGQDTRSRYGRLRWGIPGLARRYSATREQALAAMKEADAAEELARFRRGEEPSSEHLQVVLYSQLTGIDGDYEEVLAAFRQRQDEAVAQQKRVDERRQALTVAATRLRNLGVHANSYSGAITLSLETAQALVARLEGAE